MCFLLHLPWRDELKKIKQECAINFTVLEPNHPGTEIQKLKLQTSACEDSKTSLSTIAHYI